MYQQTSAKVMQKLRGPMYVGAPLSPDGEFLLLY